VGAYVEICMNMALYVSGLGLDLGLWAAYQIDIKILNYRKYSPTTCMAPFIKLRFHAQLIKVCAVIAMQESATLLQHLFYFIAHETTPLIKKYCSKV